MHLAIEQELMRAMKTDDGLTRGRGITDRTRAKWILEIPQSVPICSVLENFCETRNITSEQHVELHSSRHSSVSMEDELHHYSRPASASRTKLEKNVRGTCSSKTSNGMLDVASFRRSLKLLGLELEDSNKEHHDRGKKKLALSCRPAPTMCTRVLRRTYSLSDLLGSIQDPTLLHTQDGLNRESLAKAVYEEWYFKKLREARQKKEQQTLEQVEGQTKKEKVQEEKIRKSEINFSKWKQMKKNEKKSEQCVELKVPQNSSCNTSQSFSAKQEKINSAFLSWKQEKAKELRKKVLEDKNKRKAVEDKRKEDEENKAAANTAFQMWKSKTDEVLRLKSEVQERKKKREEEKKKKDMQEKKENARSSFDAWKRVKDEQLKNKSAEEKLANERRTREKHVRQNERLYESEQAFEEWLDHAEEKFFPRQNKKQGLRSQVQPWVPC
uniref:Microtubule-associated protein 9 n=1 Tax=Timema poppense TaxID=170557 RepID=A0A7R9H9W2_TIMPO|nr:unnamed protein product [Timema poppensis]